MKLKEKEEARKLRKEEGLSVREIARKLSVAKSSVSYWVRNVELTEEQKQNLINRCGLGPVSGGSSNKKKWEELRQQYQENGKEKAKQANSLFIAGCSLYWGEGSKTKKSQLSFVNADIDMMCLFIKFLRDCWNVKNEEMVIYINCYTNNGLTVEEIENYWLQKLNLPRTSLRKTVCNNITQTTTGKKKGKLIYGICKLEVYKVNIIQGIFGAIQELFNIVKLEWL